MGDADNLVDRLVIHGHPRVARLSHDVDDLKERIRVFHCAHVHAWDHHLARLRIAEVKDLVDHRLLLVGQLLRVGDEILDLVLRGALVVVRILDPHKARDARSGG